MKKSTMPVFLTVATGVHFGLSYLTFHEIFARNARLPGIINSSSKKKSQKKSTAPKKQDERVEWMHAQNFEEHTIVNERGQRLKGFYLEAAEKTDKFVLCAHGYRNRGKGEFRFITKFYHDNGYNVFLVDHVASGESEGDYISFGYHESKDMLLWIDYLLKTFGDDIQISLHGVSMGSATVLLLAGNEILPDNVKYVIEDCGFTNLAALFKDVLKVNPVMTAPLMKTVDMFHKMKCGFSYYNLSPIEAVKSIKIPVLFIHGGADGFIPCRMAQEMYDVCNSEKDILIVEGANHAVSYRKDSESYEKKILEFTEKYMKSEAKEV